MNNGEAGSLIEALRATPPKLSLGSRYTIANGLVYLGGGALLILWPGVAQALFGERAFIGEEQGLLRALGLTLIVIGWLYLFGGRSGAPQIVAASVVDRLIFVPLVLAPLAISGVFPRLLGAFVVLDVTLAIGAWILLARSGR